MTCKSASPMDGDLTELSSDIALCLFRIAQEALRNGVVHGDARRLVVSLVRSEDSIELNVADDGRGFDLATVRRDRHWTGTRQHRGAAHVLGGSVEIDTRPGMRSPDSRSHTRERNRPCAEGERSGPSARPAVTAPLDVGGAAVNPARGPDRGRSPSRGQGAGSAPQRPFRGRRDINDSRESSTPSSSASPTSSCWTRRCRTSPASKRCAG